MKTEYDVIKNKTDWLNKRKRLYHRLLYVIIIQLKSMILAEIKGEKC